MPILPENSQLGQNSAKPERGIETICCKPIKTKQQGQNSAKPERGIETGKTVSEEQEKTSQNSAKPERGIETLSLERRCARCI